MDNKINELHKEIMEQIKLVQKFADKNIEKLKDKIKQTDELQEKWEPERGKRYYFANPACSAFWSLSVWENDEIDNHRYKAGIIRKTEEEAAELGKFMYYRQWFRELSDVTEEMWKDGTKDKFYAYYNWIEEEVWYDSYRVYMDENAYFTSTEKLSEAIKTIGGEEILRRYVLGVE